MATHSQKNPSVILKKKNLTQIKKNKQTNKNIQNQLFPSVLQFMEFSSLSVMQIY